MRLLKSKAAAAALLFACALARLADAAGTVNVVEITGAQIKTDLLNHTYTAVDLVQSYLDRIDKFNPDYNAFTLLDRSGALAQAAALDALLANPANVPALSAQPMLGSVTVIKDSMNVAGQRTTSGFNGFAAEYVNAANGTHGVNMVALEDAPIVSRLRGAGAFILAQTNLPTFARSGANANTSFFGTTYNAVNPTRAPGGSSTGTATAVSGSFATIGTAEETGGSIQNPAGAQGLVGIKTTFGLVPTSGGVPLSGSTRDVFGTNAKTVRDAANMLTAIAGAHPSDPNTAPSTTASGNVPAAGDAASLTTTALQGQRYGIDQPGASGAFKNTSLSADVQTLYTAARDVLTAQGATVVSNVFAGSPFQTMGGYSVWGGTNLPHEMFEYMKTLDPTKSPTTPDAFKTATGGIDLMTPSSPLLGSFTPTPANPDAPLALGNNAANPSVNDAASVQKFMDGRALQLAEFRKVMADNNLDGLFFPQQSAEPGLMPGFGGTGNYSAISVSEINLLGVPQVNLPFGYYTDGAPFSVAFIGDYYTEADLLAYAYDFESALAGTGFARTAPTLVPEPATAATMFTGLTLLLFRRRRGPHHTTPSAAELN
jgi:Asp-tRNA(Asn)/Glu-tRNA(Gln) amidotransferase A subunit family amidase